MRKNVHEQAVLPLDSSARFPQHEVFLRTKNNKNKTWYDGVIGENKSRILHTHLYNDNRSCAAIGSNRWKISFASGPSFEDCRYSYSLNWIGLPTGVPEDTKKFWKNFEKKIEKGVVFVENCIPCTGGSVLASIIFSWYMKLLSFSAATNL